MGNIPHTSKTGKVASPCLPRPLSVAALPFCSFPAAHSSSTLIRRTDHQASSCPLTCCSPGELTPVPNKIRVNTRPDNPTPHPVIVTTLTRHPSPFPLDTLPTCSTTLDLPESSHLPLSRWSFLAPTTFSIRTLLAMAEGREWFKSRLNRCPMGWVKMTRTMIQSATMSKIDCATSGVIKR